MGQEHLIRIMAIKRSQSLRCCSQSNTDFRISPSPVAGKCHAKRQVIYIFDKMILHFLFVLEIKDFFNHCGRKGT